MSEATVVETAVKVKSYNRVPLEKRVKNLATVRVVTAFREANGLPKKGAIPVEHAQAFADYLRDNMPEALKDAEIELANRQANRKGHSGKRGPRGRVATPGKIHAPFQVHNDPDGLGKIVTFEFNGDAGQLLKAKVKIAAGQKNPNKPVLTLLDVIE